MVPKCLREKLTYLHHFEFTIQASEMLDKRFVTRILYSLMTFSWLIYVPVHLFPLPVYPGLQVQRYEPMVLVHCASKWHAGGEAVHSSISAAKMNDLPIKWYIRCFSSQVKPSKTKILQTEMTVEEMQGRNRNKLVFSKFPLVPFIGSLSRFQPTTT